MVAGLAACAERHAPAVRRFVNQARPLTSEETVRVLAAVRTAIAGKHGRLISAADEAAARRGTEFAIGANGRLQFLRWSGGVQGGMVTSDGTRTTWTREVTTISHLTGRPALGCDGALRTGQLIIDYRNDGGGWAATARSRLYPNSPTPLDDFLAGDLRVESGELQLIGGRSARELVAPWTAPATSEAVADARGPEYRSDDGGRTWTKTPPANVPQLIESVWIDTESLLPVRWAVMFAADPAHGVPARPHTVFSIRYDNASDLRPPSGATPPDCVP
jgi:hypothetical protein